MPEDEHLHGAGDEDLARAGGRGDPGTHVDRQAGDLPAPALHLARMHAGSDLDAEVGYGIADGTCATDGPRRTVEGGEEPVPGRVDLHAAEPLEEPPDVRVMVLQQRKRAAIAAGVAEYTSNRRHQDRNRSSPAYEGATTSASAP